MDRSGLVSRFVISLGKYLAFYPFVRPSRTLAFLRAMAERVILYDLEQTDQRAERRIPVVQLSDLFPATKEVELATPYTVSRDGNAALHEVLALCAIVKQIEAQTIFEIGTFDGRTVLLLAMNSSRDTRLFTLDLPTAACERLAYHTDPSDRKYLPGAGRSVGLQYAGTAFASKVTQLYGDSATFDYSPYYRQMDLVFIDGSHSYEYVRSDTDNAFKMVSDRGVIVWHDYRPICPGVRRCLNELSERVQLFQIAETSLVVHWAALPPGPSAGGAEASL